LKRGDQRANPKGRGSKIESRDSRLKKSQKKIQHFEKRKVE